MYLRHINGLDSIRFLCAGSVVFSPSGPPPIFQMLPPGFSDLATKLNALYSAAFPGAPAVIVFFVISGICIHFPTANGLPLKAASFYVQRFSRILLPLLVVLMLLRATDRLSLPEFSSAILWSLYCEIAYYSVYPVLLRSIGYNRQSSRLTRLRIFFALSLLVAICIVCTHLGMLNYHQGGVVLAVLLGLPVWVLGVLIAEELVVAKPRSISKIRIWMHRLWILGVAISCTYLRFHQQIGFPLTLTIFGVIVYFWLKDEIHRSVCHPSSAILEGMGKWSYSLYLFHLPANAFLPESMNETTRLVLVFVLSFIFFLLIERPAQRLAKWLKLRVSVDKKIGCAAACAKS